MKKFRLTLIFVGRTSDKFMRQGWELYESRIRRYADLNSVEVSEERVPYRGRKDYILKQEGRRIREKLPAHAFVVALDERGKSLSSEGFALSLEKWSNSGQREIAFLLGGHTGSKKT